MNSNWVWDKVDTKIKDHFKKIKNQSINPKSIDIGGRGFPPLLPPNHFSIENRLNVLDKHYDMLFRLSPLIIKDGWLRTYAEQYVKDKKSIEESFDNIITKDLILNVFVNAGLEQDSKNTCTIRFNHCIFYVNFHDNHLVMGLNSKNMEYCVARKEIHYTEGFSTINFYYKKLESINFYYEQYCDAYEALSKIELEEK